MFFLAKISFDVTVVGLNCCHAILQTVGFLFVIRSSFLEIERPVLHVPKLVRMNVFYSTQLLRGGGQIPMHYSQSLLELYFQNIALSLGRVTYRIKTCYYYLLISTFVYLLLELRIYL